jgi:hypothetical protein
MMQLSYSSGNARQLMVLACSCRTFRPYICAAAAAVALAKKLECNDGSSLCQL